MSVRGAAHEALRAATHDAHEALDALFAGFDLGDEAQYRRFLRAHAMALPPVEAALDAAGMAGLLDDWPARRRAAALTADLGALGEPPPPALTAPALPSAAAAWGAAYVLEGSRLGGAMLARSVGPGLPTSYLGTPQAAGAWRRFLERLQSALYQPEAIAAAAAAAVSVFALFGAAGRAMSERQHR